MERKVEKINISFYFRVVVKVVHHFIKQERFADEQKEGTIFLFIHFYDIFRTHVQRFIVSNVFLDTQGSYHFLFVTRLVTRLPL